MNFYKLFCRPFLFTVILFCVSSCTKDSNSSPCVDTNCSDYTSQAAAQVAFNADPECRGDLDADNDGIACEEPGNSVSTSSGGSTGGTNCPQTANCGCSGKNKSPCEADPCCKWVVGDGCRCK